VVKGGVRTVPVVEVEEVRELSFTEGRVLERTGVSPLSQGGLDKALGFTIGLWRVGAGADVTQSERSEEKAKGVRLIASPIVAHDALSENAKGSEVIQCGLKERDGTQGRFVGHNLGKGDTGGIVDSHVNKLPTRAPNLVATVAGNAMAWALNTGEFLDVCVNKFAGIKALVAAYRRRRIKQGKPMEVVATKDARDGGF
jgi:hypothetical protein